MRDREPNAAGESLKAPADANNVYTCMFPSFCDSPGAWFYDLHLPSQLNI